MSDIPRSPKTGRIRETIRRVPASYRWCAAMLVLMVVAVLFGRSRYSAQILMVKPSHSAADAVFVVDFESGQCYRAAVDSVRSGAIDTVLLCAETPRRLVSIGAIPSIEELGRQKLLNDGIAPDAIQLIQGVSRTDWETARLLDVWLNEHPAKQLRVLCDSFSGRRWSWICDRTLAKPNRSRVEIEGITDPRFDETNWWRRRLGVKVYFCSLFRLAYARWHGEDVVPDVDWSADKYESTALQ